MNHRLMLARHVKNILLAVAVSLPLALAGGCAKNEASPGAAPDFSAADLPDDEVMAGRIGKILSFTLNRRQLNSRDHAAWQVVHGILAFGSDFQIEDDGAVIPALDWLLKGRGTLRGWHLRAGGPTDRGRSPCLSPARRKGKGTPTSGWDIFRSVGLGLDEEIVVGGRTHKIRDLLEQAKWDIYQGMEATWTLMAFSLICRWMKSWQNK